MKIKHDQNGKTATITLTRDEIEALGKVCQHYVFWSHDCDGEALFAALEIISSVVFYSSDHPDPRS